MARPEHDVWKVAFSTGLVLGAKVSRDLVYGCSATLTEADGSEVRCAADNPVSALMGCVDTSSVNDIGVVGVWCPHALAGCFVDMDGNELPLTKESS